MFWATFRFYADLNDFLPDKWRQCPFSYPVYDGTQTVKNLIEALGIPHTEVDLILQNGISVNFQSQVQDGDRISVYPPFNSIAIQPQIILRPPPPNPPRFLLDNHLGRLARYLRLLGFDTHYYNNLYDDEQLAQLAQETERIMLSRDRGLLKRKKIVHGCCLRTKEPKEQLKAIIKRYQLVDQIRPWRRCLRCNGFMQPVEKREIIELLEPKTKRYFHEFQQCQECHQVYWKGSHFKHLETFITGVIEELQ